MTSPLISWYNAFCVFTFTVCKYKLNLCTVFYEMQWLHISYRGKVSVVKPVLSSRAGTSGLKNSHSQEDTPFARTQTLLYYSMIISSDIQSIS